MVRSKCRLAEIHQLEHGCKRFVFYAVCDDGTPENQKFAKYTPNATLSFMVNNPAVESQYVLGGYYYFDSISA